MKIEWSPLALERIKDIAQYIALDNLAAAENWVEGLFKTTEQLELHPKSGRKVSEVDIEPIREIIFGAYRVIYSISETQQKFRY